MRRQIEAWTKLRAPIEQAREVLANQPECLFGDSCRPEDRKARRYPTSLEVARGQGGVHHEVVVEAGFPDTVAGRLVLPIRWAAPGRGHLLPSFDGAIEIEDDAVQSRLGLRGTYGLPLGVLGRFGDSVAGRRIAQQSLASFVEQVARRLDAEVDRRNAITPRNLSVYQVDLREIGPENYLG